MCGWKHERLTWNVSSASGYVFLSNHLATNSKVAIKEMDLAKQSRLDLIVNEIMIMKESKHENIVNFLDSFLVQGNLWVVMEYMEGGALTDVIENNTMTEQQIAIVSAEVCHGWDAFWMIMTTQALTQYHHDRRPKDYIIFIHTTSFIVISSQTMCF